MDYLRLLLADNIVKNIQGYEPMSKYLVNGKIKQTIIGGEEETQYISEEQFLAGEYSGVVII